MCLVTTSAMLINFAVIKQTSKELWGNLNCLEKGEKGKKSISLHHYKHIRAAM